jgi:ABC-2 type transport system ATP-binding protein
VPTGCAIQASGISKHYGRLSALIDVSVSVEKGEIVGLLGPNGAGKTTTLSILASLLEPDTGHVSVGGLRLRGHRHMLRRKIGLVPQSVALYPSLTALANLEMFARIHGLGSRRARERCEAALALAGLAARAHHPVATLSGGMQRRLNLACGMVHGPEVLLLDEPTVGVDPQSREAIIQAVRNAAADGAAVIYSTHYMDEVERACDRVLLLDHGRVMASGTIAEIIELGGHHPRIEINFVRQPPSGWWSGVAGVKETALSPSFDSRITLEMPSVAQVSELLEQARRQGALIRDFSVHNPNLSDAFMALTGHSLRDSEPPP